MTPDHMSEADVEKWMASPEFSKRLQTLQGRINAGEPMTLESVAASLGLPWRFFAAALGAEMVKQDPGVTVLLCDNAPVVH